MPLDERNLYESSLNSLESATPGAPACVVTGYPVLGIIPGGSSSTAIQFKRPGCYANKEDWNKFTMTAKMTPTNTSLTNILKFIAEWCGSAPNFSFH